MRLATACTTCRSNKRKCRFSSGPDSPCDSCQSRNIPCSGNDLHTGHSSTEASSSSSSHSKPKRRHYEDHRGERSVSVTDLPPSDVCVELVRLYFEFIHDQFHSLFHRPSLEGELRDGSLPGVILYAIVALAARFSTDSFFEELNPRERSHGYAVEASRLLDLGHVSLQSIQVCVLLGTISNTEGNAPGGSVYYSAATQMANLMDLANMATETALEREVNIRVLWTLYMVDTWTSYGNRRTKLVPTIDTLPPPSSERLFLSLRREDIAQSSPLANHDLEVSLIAEMVKLNHILIEVNDLNVQAVAHHLPEVEVASTVEHLSQKLDIWHESQPPSMQMTTENLSLYSSHGLGRTFVAVYLGYYHFGQLLFYRFLHDAHQTTFTRPHLYATKCKAYATGLCELLYTALSTPGCQVYYMMVGHVLAIASTVQIHTLLFDDNETQIALARTRLERNFEIISKLREFWPTLDISYRRFREFHDACRRSMETSFRMDQWMLGFLLEFAKPEDGVRELEVGSQVMNVEELDGWRGQEASA